MKKKKKQAQREVEKLWLSLNTLSLSSPVSCQRHHRYHHIATKSVITHQIGCLYEPTTTRYAIIHQTDTLLKPASTRSIGTATTPPLPWLGIEVKHQVPVTCITKPTVI
ncbi:hypothetical protein CsSME_00024779 [Camellia sinensis var. sinensis]